MQCQTLKPGVECLFMKKTGCGYNGARCYTVVHGLWRWRQVNSV
jgi:hypothetical protein